MQRSFPRRDEEPTPPSFPLLFVGCTLQPGETAIRAFAADRHFVNSLASIFCFLAVFFGPVLYYQYGFGVASFSQAAVAGFTLVVLFFFMCWAFLQTVMFLVFGVPVTLLKAIAILCYSLNPITLTLIIIYAFNSLSSGTISFHGLLFTGRLQGADTYLRVIPYASWILTAIVLYLFMLCIREAGRLSTLVAIGLTVLSLVPLSAAFVIAVTLGEVVEPGTAAVFSRLLELYLHSRGG
ncbi:MAG: hypothetical protein QY326_09570 [Bdellovibrionota bacterium]|nr:MAG: hypothetical protein QY326_09570 [Bdellovibrionota bacterium]